MSDVGNSTAAVAVGDGPASRPKGVSLRVTGLRKSYGDREVVRGVDFEVQAGECFGLLGRNGAGKTTIIEICEGYTNPDAGVVEVLGEDPQSPSHSWRSRLGIVPQEMEVLPTLTVRETVTMFASLYPRSRDVDEVLGLVGLRERSQSRVGKLSGGEKRRLDVAVGLIGDPEIVFLDEPTTGLDPEARREMWAMIEGLKSSGVTIILTTHYMEEAQVLADRLVIVAEGVVAARGTFEELLARRGGNATISFRLPEGIGSHTALMPLVDSATIEGSVVEIRSRDVQADLGSLLTWAHAAEVELADITVTRDSLEDLFLAIDGPDAHTESQEVAQ